MYDVKIVQYVADFINIEAWPTDLAVPKFLQKVLQNFQNLKRFNSSNLVNHASQSAVRDRRSGWRSRSVPGRLLATAFWPTPDPAMMAATVAAAIALTSSKLAKYVRVSFDRSA